MGFDRLIEAIAEKKNPTVAGLDPKLDYVPQYIRKQSFEKYGFTLEGAADALLTFNKGLIDALCDIVPAVKPQCAYYEMYGWKGARALYETISYAKRACLSLPTASATTSVPLWKLMPPRILEKSWSVKRLMRLLTAMR